MATKTNTDDGLARRLVAQVVAVASDRPNRRRWVLLAEIVNRLDVSWDEAELAAVFAAAQGWIEYQCAQPAAARARSANAGGRCAAEASQAGLRVR